MEEDMYEDYDEDLDNDESLILSIGEDGKAEIRNPDDFVEIKRNQMEIIGEYLNENKDNFDAWLHKKDYVKKFNE